MHYMHHKRLKVILHTTSIFEKMVDKETLRTEKN